MSLAVADRQMGRLFRLAIVSGADAAVQAHLARGEDVNAVDSRGLSPLMIAAAKGHLSTCRVLLKAGSDVNAVDGQGNNARWHAASIGMTAIIDLLTPAPAPVLVEAGSAQEESHAAAHAGREEDPSSFSWESEDEPECPPLVIVPLENARRLQQKMASCRALVSDPDIEIDVQLPVLTPPRDSALDVALPELAQLLAAGKGDGWVSAGHIGRLARDSSCGARHLRQAFEAAGILVAEPWPFELPDPGDRGDSVEDVVGAEEIADYLESLAGIGVDPLELYRSDLRRFPRLDRFEEDSLARSGDRGMQQACLALAASPEGLSILVADLDDVCLGRRSLSSVSSLFEDFGHGTGEDDDSEVEDAGETVTAGFATAVDDLRGAIDDFDWDAHSTDRRNLARHVRNLGLTTEYFAGLCTTLSSRAGGVGDAFEIRRGLNVAEKARRRLVEAHFGHVVVAAARFGRNLPVADLVQEGNLGLLRAAEKFDPERGNRFWTYAIWWVRQSLSRASADKSRMIRLPVHVSEALARLRKMDRESVAETGDVADASRQAEEIGISTEMVVRLRAWRGEPVAAGMLVGDGTDPHHLLNIPSNECAFDAVLAKDLCRSVEIALQELDARQADIIRRRFGLAGMEEQTLEEIGSIYGVTRERIRQIEDKALRKLHHPARSNLRHYL